METSWFDVTLNYGHRNTTLSVKNGQRPLILFHHLRPCRRASIRCIASSSASNSNTPYPSQGQKSWVTRQVETPPFARKVFMALATALGYASPRQMVGRRAFVLYNNVCAR